MVLLNFNPKALNTVYSKSNYLLLLLGLFLFFITLFFERKVTWQASDYEKITVKAQNALLVQEKLADRFIDSLMNNLVKSPETIWEGGFDFTEKYKATPKGFSFFILKGNSLRYWSDNNILFDQLPTEPLKEKQLIFMKNGWYEYFGRTTGNIMVSGFLLIKHQYEFENKYIDNSFNKILELPEFTSLELDINKSKWKVNNVNGDFLFGINFLGESVNPTFEFPIMILFFSSIVILLLFLYSFGKYLVTVNPAFAFLIIILLIFLRWIGLYYRLPETLYNLPLFSPQFYASSFLLNSLGDFLISTLVFTYLVIFFHYYFGITKLTDDHGKYKLLLSYQVVFVFLFTFLFSVFVNYLLSGLILDSKISFNINNIFELSIYSLIGFAIIGMLLFSFYLICDGAIRFIQKTQFTIGQISILFLITQGLFLIILLWLRDSELFHDYGVTSFLLANSLIIFISYVRSSSKRLFSFTRTLLVILGFSVYAAKTIADFNEVKEKENRKLLAIKLENEHDLVAEYLFEEVTSKIANDKFIIALLSAANEQVFPFTFNYEIIPKRIKQLYLNGYWGKFEAKIKCFDYRKNTIGPAQDKEENLTDYENKVKNFGMPTYSDGFYYISNTAGRASYIGIVKPQPVSANSSSPGTIVLELNSRFVQDEGGFPEILLSDRIPEQKDFSNYSYAKYESSVLINQYGKYPYLFRSDGYNNIYDAGKSDRFIDFNGYSHLFYRHGLNGLIIISKQNQRIVVLVTLFSYIFSFFCLLFVSIYIIYRLFRSSFRFDINFKTRIQFTVFAIVMSTILLTGGGTIYYIIGNYATNQNQKVSERLSSLLVLIENELGKTPLLPDRFNEDLALNFSRLSANLAVDFNIFGTNGRLIYSSQPKIFEKNIMAPTMNTYAYNELHIKQRTIFVQYEQVGTLNFLSAYEPLRDLKNNIIGYVNLPYFAKQNVLKKEISSLLVTLINIYVFLFSIAMFVTFVISNRITRPLGLIQKRLSQIKLGKRTEPIEWSKKDEIGGLVNVYNSMVDELHNSAELLAKSERESAWREMAKQVAHEIKNPLTPMKLSVQHLQRAWREQSPNLDTIMQRFSQTLIEQIDTLSNIANEFSNFAKMPKTNNTVLNIAIILENIVTLYGESEKIKIHFDIEKFSNLQVFADKDQLIRAFSNLFKNAIQAIPENKEGLIHVEVIRNKNNFIILISDNGEGIPDDRLQNIFVPNFTTKTGGTGLGLAMVKNIIEMAGGKIWFETKIGEGTSFYVQLPMYEEHQNNS